MTFTISLTRILAIVSALIIFAGESAALLWLLDSLFVTGLPFTVGRVAAVMGILWLLMLLFGALGLAPTKTTEVSQ